MCSRMKSTQTAAAQARAICCAQTFFLASVLFAVVLLVLGAYFVYAFCYQRDDNVHAPPASLHTIEIASKACTEQNELN